MQKSFLEDFKKTIVFIGYWKTTQGEVKEELIGTAFLVQIEGVFCLVTAKHVIAEIDDKGNVLQERQNLLVFNNLIKKEKGIRFVSLDIRKKDGFNWFFHDNSLIDLAIMPFPLNIQEDDVKVCPDTNFLSLERICETNDVFFLSYQPGVTMLSDGEVLPLIRKGAVARKNNNKSFLIDGAAFPGNSGSPVYMLPAAIRIDDNGNINLGGDILGGKFIGVVSNYIHYQDIAISAQTKRARIIFEENTGLSTVWSSDCLLEITKQDGFQIALNALKSDKKILNSK